MHESGNYKQTFIAPGDEDEAFPIKDSPWNIGRMALIPMKSWNLLLEYAEAFDAGKVQKLDDASWARDFNEDDYVYLSDNEIDELILFMEELRLKLMSASPIDPEGFYNEEYVKMLNIIVMIFEESKNRKQPYRAWR